MAVSDTQFVSAYLDRIGYHGELSHTIEVLRALQRQHVSAVPFENLDLICRLPPNLERDFLFDKIVRRRRGGVCYELNRSFLNLLLALGFQADCVTGQVRVSGVMNEHALSLVHLDSEDYLVDVGLGDNVLPPLNPDGSERVHAFGCDYYVLHQGPELLHLMKQPPGLLPTRLYTVTLTPKQPEDYMDQFRWSATPGNSHFTAGPICSIAYPNGRAELRRGVLKVSRDGVTTVTRVTDEPELSDCLKKYFQIYNWRV